MARSNLLSVSAISAVAFGLLLLMQPTGSAQQAAAPARAAAAATEKGGDYVSGPHDVAKNWPQPLHEDWTWGRTGGVWAESPDRVFVLQTGEIPKATRHAEGNPRRCTRSTIPIRAPPSTACSSSTGTAS